MQQYYINFLLLSLSGLLPILNAHYLKVQRLSDNLCIYNTINPNTFNPQTICVANTSSDKVIVPYTTWKTGNWSYQSIIDNQTFTNISICSDYIFFGVNPYSCWATNHTFIPAKRVSTSVYHVLPLSMKGCDTFLAENIEFSCKYAIFTNSQNMTVSIWTQEYNIFVNATGVEFHSKNLQFSNEVFMTVVLVIILLYSQLNQLEFNGNDAERDFLLFKQDDFRLLYVLIASVICVTFWSAVSHDRPIPIEVRDLLPKYSIYLFDGAEYIMYTISFLFFIVIGLLTFDEELHLNHAWMNFIRTLFTDFKQVVTKETSTQRRNDIVDSVMILIFFPLHVILNSSIIYFGFGQWHMNFIRLVLNISFVIGYTRALMLKTNKLVFFIQILSLYGLVYSLVFSILPFFSMPVMGVSTYPDNILVSIVILYTIMLTNIK